MNEIQGEIRRNPVLTEVLETLIVQTKKGMAKYGTTVNYESLSASEWIEHAKEETADKLVYLTCLEKSIGLMEKKAKAFDKIWGILEDFHHAGTLSGELVIELVGKEISKVFADSEVVEEREIALDYDYLKTILSDEDIERLEYAIEMNRQIIVEGEQGPTGKSTLVRYLKDKGLKVAEYGLSEVFTLNEFLKERKSQPYKLEGDENDRKD